MSLNFVFKVYFGGRTKQMLHLCTTETSTVCLKIEKPLLSIGRMLILFFNNSHTHTHKVFTTHYSGLSHLGLTGRSEGMNCHSRFWCFKTPFVSFTKREEVSLFIQVQVISLLFTTVISVYLHTLSLTHPAYSFDSVSCLGSSKSAPTSPTLSHSIQFLGASLKGTQLHL